MHLPRPFKAAWKNSQTKLLASLQAASGGVLFAIQQLYGSFNDPTIKSYLATITLPKSITIGLIALGVITYLAHGHDDA